MLSALISPSVPFHVTWWALKHIHFRRKINQSLRRQNTAPSADKRLGHCYRWFGFLGVFQPKTASLPSVVVVIEREKRLMAFPCQKKDRRRMSSPWMFLKCWPEFCGKETVRIPRKWRVVYCLMSIHNSIVPLLLYHRFVFHYPPVVMRLHFQDIWWRKVRLNIWWRKHLRCINWFYRRNSF